MQEVVLKDWSEQERLNDLFEVTQFPNCLCERGGKKVEVWWVIDRLWVGQGEKEYFVQNVWWYEALNMGRKLWKGRPGELPVQFGRQQAKVQLIFSKSSSEAA